MWQNYTSFLQFLAKNDICHTTYILLVKDVTRSFTMCPEGEETENIRQQSFHPYGTNDVTETAQRAQWGGDIALSGLHG
jgi:hypothetical protein